MSARLIVEYGADAKPPTGEAMRSLVGGKALPLLRLSAGGLPVPPGFVLTTAAFERGLQAILADAPSLRDARERLLDPETAFPDDLRTAIDAAHARLVALMATADGPNAPLAVRSSATDEDGEHRSFAGQQASVLNARGLDGLLAAVRTVWASLLAPDALLYRERQRLDAAPPTMAVLVQPLVPAEVAGVLFTSNPMDGSRDTMVVSAAFGLGESVVGGDRADTWVLDRDGRVVRRDVASKTERRVPSPEQHPGLLVAEPLADELRDAASLTDAQLASLVALGTKVEARFGGDPQDIEFAVVPGAETNLVLLQARPVTHGADNVPLTSTGHRATLYSNANVGEALPGVGTPMTWSIIHGFARRGFETAFGALGLDVPDRYPIVASFRGRVYLNISEFVSVASQIPMLTGETLAHLAGVVDATGLEGTYEQLSPSAFLGRLPMTVPRLLFSQLTMPARSRAWGAAFERRRDRCIGTSLDTLDHCALAALFDDIDDAFGKTGDVMLAASSNFLMSYVAATELLQLLGGPEAARKESVLFSGLTNVKSAAPGLELLEIAREIRDDAELRELVADPDRGPREVLGGLDDHPAGRRLRARLDDFLGRWGLRGLREAEIATPRWREDPSFLIGVLRRHLAAPRLPSAEEVEADQARQRADATEVIRQHFLTGTGVAFRSVLRWAQANARQREHLRAYVVDTLSMYRHGLLEVGRRLVAAGALCEADDVFFLTYPEVRRWLADAHALDALARRRVAQRRAQHAAFVQSPDPPDTFVLEQGIARIAPRERETRPPAAVHGGLRLEGLPGSPGRVTGVARVLDTPEGEIPIEPGEILVTTFTDVGWTPLFLVAAGVVTDRGGPLSHSCVVAREYGIPAVVGVGDATRIIRTGDRLRLDGAEGTVHVVRARDDTA